MLYIECTKCGLKKPRKFWEHKNICPVCKTAEVEQFKQNVFLRCRGCGTLWTKAAFKHMRKNGGGCRKCRSHQCESSYAMTKTEKFKDFLGAEYHEDVEFTHSNRYRVEGADKKEAGHE